MKRFLLEKYAKLRSKFNPVKPERDNPKWKEYMSLDMNSFSAAINKFKYRPDLLKGIIDRTETFSHFINPAVQTDRDCDDFARMWTMWGLENGYKAVEMIVTTKKKFFKNSHVVTILTDKDKAYLMNYRPCKNTGTDWMKLLVSEMSSWYGCDESELLYAVSLVGGRNKT